MRIKAVKGTHKICLTAAIIYRKKLLIVKRSKSDEYLPGKWELIGGSLKNSESYDRGLQREIMEETNLQYQGPFNPFFCFTRSRIKNGMKENVFEVFFICLVKTLTTLKLSKEHSRYTLIKETQIDNYFDKKELFYKGVRQAFQNFEAKQGN